MGFKPTVLLAACELVPDRTEGGQVATWKTQYEGEDLYLLNPKNINAAAMECCLGGCHARILQGLEFIEAPEAE